MLQLSLSTQRFGVSRPKNATHDCDRVLEHLKRLVLFIAGGVTVQYRAREVLTHRQRELVFSTVSASNDSYFGGSLQE